MPRGLGHLQISILTEFHRFRQIQHLSVDHIAALVYKVDYKNLTPSQIGAVRRAIHRLTERKQLKLSSHTFNGRQCWYRTEKDLIGLIPNPGAAPERTQKPRLVEVQRDA